ncbi:helix-turn-helix domain-containing protein [Frigidibacter sp. MR17.14]|uniref:helix-turn-helix domain-containing protein n=1 Tax=Frigidibacter sp. MR17.14 TaxID=3126509 RepID=UPI003013043B
MHADPPDRREPPGGEVPRISSAVVLTGDDGAARLLETLFTGSFGWWTRRCARIDEARAACDGATLLAAEVGGSAAAAALAVIPAGLRLAVDPGLDGAGLAAALAAGFDEAVRTPLLRAEIEARLRRIPVIAGRGDPLLYRLAATPAGEPVEIAGTEDGSLLKLTPIEADILRVLAREAGRTVTRDDLSRLIDRCDWDYGDRKFDVHVTRIRRKLTAGFGDRYQVAAVRSVGYRLEA